MRQYQSHHSPRRNPYNYKSRRSLRKLSSRLLANPDTQADSPSKMLSFTECPKWGLADLLATELAEGNRLMPWHAEKTIVIVDEATGARQEVVKLAIQGK